MSYLFLKKSLTFDLYNYFEVVMKRFQIGNFDIDVSRCRISSGDYEIILEPKVMDVLHYLYQYKGQVVSQEQIFSVVWPSSTFNPSSVQRCIALLRKALKEDSKNQNGLNALSVSCEAIALSAKLLYPVMPKKCEEIFNILEIKKETINNLDFETISGNSINPHKALFPRIENDD